MNQVLDILGNGNAGMLGKNHKGFVDIIVHSRANVFAFERHQSDAAGVVRLNGEAENKAIPLGEKLDGVGVFRQTLQGIEMRKLNPCRYAASPPIRNHLLKIGVVSET